MSRGGDRVDELLLGGIAEEAAAGSSWGVYAGAVERWEQALGRAAPAPTDERGRLSPEFVEWMLGFPDGWTAGGLARTARLKMLGNAVQVQVAEVVGSLLAGLAETET